MFHNFLRAQAAFVYKRALSICVFLAVTTALALPFALQLNLKANLINLLPEDMPSVLELKGLTEKVGGTSYLVVAIESTDEQTVITASDLFSQSILDLEYVDYVDNRTNVKSFRTRKFLFLTIESLEKIKKHAHDLIGFYRRKANPFYIDLLDESVPVLAKDNFELEERVNGIGSFSGKEFDSYMRVILIKPTYPISDFAASGIFFKEVKGKLREIEKSLNFPITVGFTGPYKMRYDEYQVILKDLNRTGLLTFILIVVLVCLFFRNVRSMLLASTALGVGIIWTAAFTQLTIGYLNLITTFLLAILFGLGISFVIHILVRYQEERKLGVNPREALETTFVDIGEPMLSSALTSSIAFLSLTVSSFYGFKHFGMIAGFGIMFCFISTVYGVSSMIVLGERFYKAHHSMYTLKAGWGKQQAWPIYTLLLLGAAFSLYTMLNLNHVTFEYDFAKLQQVDAESIVYSKRIGDHFGVVLNPVGIVTKNRDEAAHLAAKINAKASQDPESTIDFAASILSHVPRDQTEKIALLRDIDSLLAKREALIKTLNTTVQNDIAELREQLAPESLTLAEIPEGIRNQYEDAQGTFSVIYVYPKSSLLDGQMAKRFVRELRSLDLGTYKLAGEPVIYADILTLLDQDTLRAMLISLFLVIVLLFIHFRKARHVALVLSPVLVAFLWMIGLSVLFKFKFNYLNLTILPSILGVGIDSGIHIFHRYKRENQTTLYGIMQKAGLAVILSSLTTMAAFVSLHFASHQGMSSLGTLGVLGFASCLLASVLLIPAIIEFNASGYGKALIARRLK